MRIAYFGYDFFWTCLDALIAEKHEIVAVFTFATDNKYNHNSNLTRLAASTSAPVRFDKPIPNDLIKLHDLGCELLIAAAYPYKIPMERSPVRGINIHPTMLPFGRGPWPLPHLIYSYPQYAGISIHQLAPKFDAGAILLQRPLVIEERENLESLSAKLQISARDSLLYSLERLDELWAAATPQVGGSYWKMPSDEEQTVQWNEKVATIDRKVRAFGKFDTNAVIDSKKYFFHDVTVWPCQHGYTPGATVHRMNREVVVAALDGFVCVRFCEPA